MSHEFRQFVGQYLRTPVDPRQEPWRSYRPFLPIQLGEYGIPGPGPDFLRIASELGRPDPMQAVAELYWRAAYDDSFALPTRFKQAIRPVSFVPGGTWGWPAQGPIRHHPVMVVGKHPGGDEITARKNLVGPAGAELQRILCDAGVDFSSWYVTNVVRHNHMNPNGGKLDLSWIKNCAPLLAFELQQVRPNFLLLLGAEAVQTVLGGKGKGRPAVSFAKARTQVTPIEIDLPDGTKHSIQVCACYHPSYVLRSPERTPELVEDIRKFARLLRGGGYEVVDQNVLHLVVDRESQLKNVVDYILKCPRNDAIAVDAEWHGDYPGEPGAYLRTVQFSWASGKAVIVRLHHAGGQPAFEGGIEAAVRQMSRLMKSTADRQVRIIGHNLIADMPWLISIGLDLRREFEVAAWPAGEHQDNCEPAWELTKTIGGFDTMIAAHAVEETQELKLEALCSNRLGLHRYDKKLQEWKAAELRRRNLKEDELEGYGECPAEVLEGESVGELTEFGQPVKDSYGGFDADATWRLFDHFNGSPGSPGALDRDRFGRSSRQAFWRTMWSFPAFGECHTSGILVDVSGADELATHYKTAAERLLADFREKIHWPDFKIGSSHHKVEFLFGEEYTSKRNKLTGEPVRIRPEGDNDKPEAICLRLPPYKTTGKKSKLWEKIQAQGKQEFFSVSADKEVLAVLSHDPQGNVRPLVAQLRDILKLSQLGKTVLRPQVALTVKKKVRKKLPYSEETARLYKKTCPCALGTLPVDPPCKCGFATVIEDVPNSKIRKIHEFDDEEHGYDGGIFRYIMSDGRVRSQFYPVKETGRASSARPALQNWSKTLEADYVRILNKEKMYRGALGDLVYPRPMRSILVARPGYLLVDCDYTGAELAIAAWMSGDPTMIEHVRRNNLDEKDPNYFDIHSSIAVRAFRLTVPDGVISDAGLAAKLKVAVGISYSELLGAPVGAPLPFTKTALTVCGKSALRTAAKRVIFGKLYGQMAESMARKIREEGVEITVDQAAQIDRTIDDQYPLCAAYMHAASTRPRDFGWLTTCFGRNRRFMPTIEEAVQAAQAREAMNFPMQGSVADAMQTAMGHLYRYRRENGMEEAYTINLQVHDAIVLEVAIPYLDRVVDEVLPTCMSDRVVIWPTDHGGQRKPGGPFRLKAPPADVFEKWSVGLKVADCQRLGISSRYAVSA